jgi:predicted transcriptional regulator
MISEILKTIENEELTFSEIQFKTYLTYQHLKRYSTYLVHHELISYVNEDRRFRITHIFI